MTIYSLQQAELFRLEVKLLADSSKIPNPMYWFSPTLRRKKAPESAQKGLQNALEKSVKGHQRVVETLEKDRQKKIKEGAFLFLIFSVSEKISSPAPSRSPSFESSVNVSGAAFFFYCCFLYCSCLSFFFFF